MMQNRPPISTTGGRSTAGDRLAGSCRSARGCGVGTTPGGRHISSRGSVGAERTSRGAKSFPGVFTKFLVPVIASSRKAWLDNRLREGTPLAPSNCAYRRGCLAGGSPRDGKDSSAHLMKDLPFDGQAKGGDDGTRGGGRATSPVREDRRRRRTGCRPDRSSSMWLPPGICGGSVGPSPSERWLSWRQAVRRASWVLPIRRLRISGWGGTDSRIPRWRSTSCTWVRIPTNPRMPWS